MEEARDHFEKGKTLVSEGAWAAALTEFLQSRKLHPNRSATSSAAVCLQKLGRHDEALDLFEILLRESPNLPADMKTAAQREVVELHARVGVIEIRGAEPGATLTIDRQSRGEYPPLGPLRVAAGYHIVRVYKEGFEPFERGLDVAGGQMTAVEARLPRLLQAGRLSVQEQGGKSLDVLVDGNVVGRTPWEGPIAAGEHAVELRGAESLGALPRRIAIRPNEPAKVVFTAERLDASVKVVPSPGDATVAIDDLFVGRGIWDGRLRPGVHRVKLVADGYFPEVRSVELAQGSDKVLALSLRKDPSSPAWRRPGRFGLELDGAAAVSPSLGGDIARACSGACRTGAAVGGHVVVHGGYELWNGVGFGVSVGYLSLLQRTTGRAETLTPVGRAADHGIADDTLKLRGFRAGGWASYRTGGARLALQVRLGAGALVGSVSDTRSGTFRVGAGTRACPLPPAMSDPSCFSIGTAIAAPTANFFYVSPEVRLGLRLGSHVELSAGVEGLVLFGLGTPTWDKTLGIFGAKDGYATFGGARLAGSILGVILPGVGARYQF